MIADLLTIACISHRHDLCTGTRWNGGQTFRGPAPCYCGCHDKDKEGRR